jgi:hypothetical protein
MVLTGRPKYSDKSLPHCHFIHQESHVDWPGIEPGPTTNCLSQVTCIDSYIGNTASLDGVTLQKVFLFIVTVVSSSDLGAKLAFVYNVRLEKFN